MNLAARRRAIRPLIDGKTAADALASYYAFYHPDQKTGLIITPADAARAQGYIAVSRTGLDLFRPLVTMRLPLNDHEAAAGLIQEALPPEAPVILYAPENHAPLLNAFFTIQTEERLRVLVLDHGRYEPVINVLVTQDVAPTGYTRFIIRSQLDANRVVASAGINWQTPDFAEISVFTEPGQRRQGWGKSVVSALCHYLLDRGRTPLFAVSEANRPSLELADNSGFVDLGIRRLLLEAERRPATT